MKSLISKVMLFGVLYAVAAGGTTLYFNMTKAPEEESSEGEENKEGISGAKDPPPPQVPVALRPKNNVSVEAIVQMSDSIRRTEQRLEEQKKQLAADEERVGLLFEDLELEREELKALNQSLDAKLQTMAETADRLQGMMDELDRKKQDLASLEKATGTDPESVSQELESRVNDVKSWFENLEANQAADYLREFANNGKMDFAALLLQKMPDRQKSKILAAMSDPQLVSQLVEAVKVSKP